MLLRSLGCAEELTQPVPQQPEILDFALPNDQGLPSSIRQGAQISGVPFDILSEFSVPEVRPRLWPVGISAALVTVPKAAVNEDRLSSAREY